jgi:hypothetical protein
MGLSERTIRSSILNSLPIWTDSGKQINLEQLEGCVQKEASLIKRQEEDRLFGKMDANRNIVAKNSKKRKRIVYPAVVLFFLLLGGTINQGTIEETRANAGPDIVKLYQDGGLFSITEKLQEEGYTELSTSPSYMEKIIYLYTRDYETSLKKDKIVDFVKKYLKEREINYEISFIYSAMQESENIENKMNREIVDLLSASTNDYILSGSQENSVEFSIPDSLTAEEERNLESSIKEVYKKYNSPMKFSFAKFDSKKHDLETKWWNIAKYILEAFSLKEEYVLRNFSVEYKNNRMEMDIYIYYTEEEQKEKFIAKEMKRSINKFLQKEEIQEKIKGDSYLIRIFDKNEQEIKTE